ncbi:hypothetical protein D7V82_05510 [bacterium 1xD8-6]|nr:hypothetical protein D7V72_06190 [bacterium D16-36]RKI71646.1 hypothetical protein D7V82_05510 [bacterium 1xD8-6]
MTSKLKLRFRFHNPNSAEETADYIAKIFVEVNKEKVDVILQEAAGKMEVPSKEDRSLSR